MAFWPLFFISLGFQILGELLRPKPKFESAKPSSLGDFRFPTAQEGRVIPIFAGRCKFTGPNVTWYGDLEVIPIKVKQKTGLFSSTKVTVGYKYFLGLQAVFAVGKVDEFIQLRFDDKTVNIGTPTDAGDYWSFNMASPTLFGKEKEEGGVTGPCKLYKGTFTQPVNDYLKTALAQTALTAYRPISHLIFEHAYLGNSSTLPGPTVIMGRYPNTLGVTGGKHRIGNDANAACWLYEIMTDRVTGACIPTTLVDQAAFIAVAETLYAEGLGISMIVDSEQDADKLISEILRHIDGVIYPDIETGLYTISLARGGYDISTLLVLDQSSIDPKSVEFSRSSWEDTQNTVKVKYIDRDQDYTERTVQQQNLANISVRGGQIDAVDYDFNGLSNAAAANQACARILTTASSPFATVSFKANRKAYKLRPASVFKWVWPQLGITSMVLRVTDIDYGTIEDPDIKITAVEDVFGVTNVAYSDPPSSGWTPPPLTAQAIADALVFEAPYAFVGQNRALVTLGVRAGLQELGYQVWSDPAGGTAFTETNEAVDFTPTAVLVADYGKTTHAIDNTGFLVSNAKLLEALDALTSSEFGGGTYLLRIDNEFLAFTQVVNNNDGTYTVKGVAQGVLDTLPARHLAGAKVYFVSEGYGLVDPGFYDSNVTVKTKLLPYTRSNTYPLASAATLTNTIAQRAWKPYPPAGMTVNGMYFDNAVISGATDPLVLAWNHRDRTQQINASVVLAQNAASIGPETGVTYTLKLYDEAGNLARTETGLTASTYTWTTEADDSASSTAGDSYVKTLLHFDGANNSTTIIDDTGKVWTCSGNAKISTAQSVFGGTSLALDGSGDYISTPNSADFTFGTGDFTIECFVYFNSVSGQQCIATNSGTTTTGWAVQLYTGKIIFNASGDGVDATGTTTILANTWYHVTVTRQGASLRIFVNGNLDVTVTNSVNISSSSGVRIGGAIRSSTVYVNGYIDEVRITKGVAHYLASFTPPAAPFTITDPNYSNVVALFHFDTNTGFKSTKGATWTASGNAVISTASSRAGNASLFLDGAGDYLSYTDTNDDYAFGSSDFTIETWFNSTGWPGGTAFPCIIAQRNSVSSAHSFTFYVNSTGTSLNFAYTANGSTVTTVAATFTFSTNTWYHVAVCRQGSNLYIFVNGVLQTTATISGSIYNSSAVVRIGAFDNPIYSTSYWKGYLDELRVSKGIARYTANFVPPAYHPGSSRLNQAGRVVLETYKDGTLLAHQNYDFNWTRPSAAA